MSHIPPPQSFDDFERMALAEIGQPFVSRFGRVSWRALDDAGPNYEYLIEQWVSKSGKSVVGGPSQSGKSFLTIHMAMCVARGVPFFGQEVSKGLVIYQAGEGAVGVRRKRLKAYRNHFKIADDEEVPFELLMSPVDLYHTEGDTGAFIEECRGIATEYPHLPLALIVIDTLATATSGADENSGKDMGTVMKNVARIEQATGAHVMLVHHMNAKGDKLRGHTSIYANVDQVILVSKDETSKVRTARLDKQKDDENGLEIRFELMAVETGGRKPNGDPVTSCVCLPPGEKEAVRGARNTIHPFIPSPVERKVFGILWEALKRHGTPATAEQAEAHDVPVGTELIEWGHYRAVAKALDVGGGDASDPRSAGAIYKEFERNHARLLSEGVIGLSKPLMWWKGRPVKGIWETYKKSGQSADKRRTEADNTRTDHTETDRLTWGSSTGADEDSLPF